MRLTAGEQLKIAYNRSGYTYSDIKRELGIHPTTMKIMFDNKGTMGTWVVLMNFLQISFDMNVDNLRCKEDDYKIKKPLR